MSTFFSSDWHIGHKRIMEYCPKSRALAGGDLKKMKQLILDGVRDTVGPNDTLYLLGDISFTTSVREVEELLMSIRVKELHLVVGNHEHTITGSRRLMNYFDSVSHYKEIKIGDDRLILMHYPIESWNHKYHGAYHLHGHTHMRNDDRNEDFHRGALQKMTRRFDVGIDSRDDFKPWKWEDIKQFIADREASASFTKMMDQGV